MSELLKELDEILEFRLSDDSVLADAARKAPYPGVEAVVALLRLRESIQLVRDLAAAAERNAQPSAEPVAWMSWDGDVIDDRTKSAAMRTVGMSSSIAAKYDEPLYLHPPTDSAALRERPTAAEIEALRRDARRYRWLRDDNDNDASELYAVRIDYWSDEYRGQAGCEILGGDYLDRDIDAAIAQQEAP